VSYRTSSGVTGVTDAAGKYQFNPGDTVKFTIGAAVLGEVTAKGLLTPLDLAQGDATKLINLLVVLQSLDADGNPDNGITIPEAVAKAMPTVDLTASTSTLTAGLRTAMDAGGLTHAVKTEENAKEHFQNQAMKLLAANVWAGFHDDGTPSMLMLAKENGEYLFAEIDPAADTEAGHSGIEHAKLVATSVNANGYYIGLAANPGFTPIDTTGDWGLSHMQDHERVAIDAGEIRVGDKQEDGSVVMRPTFKKIENVQDGILGAWAVDEPNDGVADGVPFKAPILAFFRSGHVLVIEPNGANADDECVGSPGAELGRFSYDRTTKKLVRLPQRSYDGNGCVGMWDNNTTNPDNAPVEFTVSYSADGNKATLTAGGDVVNLVRLSR
jgi:hypothetical protein